MYLFVFNNTFQQTSILVYTLNRNDIDIAFIDNYRCFIIICGTTIQIYLQLKENRKHSITMLVKTIKSFVYGNNAMQTIKDLHLIKLFLN